MVIENQNKFQTKTQLQHAQNHTLTQSEPSRLEVPNGHMLNSTAKLIIIMQDRSNGVHNMKLHYKTAHAAQAIFFLSNLPYSSILVSKPHPFFHSSVCSRCKLSSEKDGGGLGMRTTLQLQLVSYSLVA